MSEISTTGFWDSNSAHTHHVHCPNLAQWIGNFLKDEKDKPLYDFGCGLGEYLLHLSEVGFTKLTGYEGDPPKKKKFHNIVKQDLSKDFIVNEPGNVIFLEVAEHVPAEYEEQLLTNVSAACDNLLICSWAIRGQAGFGHVNCLNNDEAISKIQNYGFNLLKLETDEVRKINLDQAPWFYNTLFIFSR